MPRIKYEPYPVTTYDIHGNRTNQTIEALERQLDEIKAIKRATERKKWEDDRIKALRKSIRDEGETPCA